MFKELFSSLTSNLKDRVNSPILGAYVVIWCAVNWRGLYVLLHPLPTARETISAFDAFSSNWTLCYTPVLITLIYLVSCPWLHWFYFQFQASPRQKRIIGEYQLEKKALEAKKDAISVQYQIEFLKAEREHALEIEKLEAHAEIEERKIVRQQSLEKRRRDEDAEREHTKKKRELELTP